MYNKRNGKERMRNWTNNFLRITILTFKCGKHDESKYEMKWRSVQLNFHYEFILKSDKFIIKQED